MRFSLGMAFRNIRRRPARAVFMCMIVVFLSFALLTGGYLLISLQNGLEGYRARLGADIVVVPSSAQGHGTVDEILLQGITGNYYIPSAGLNKLESIEGIEEKTEQFYLTSAKASCCSARVQMIGFDPKTDFTVMPWISGSVDGNIGDGDILIGADIAYPADGYLRFYGDSYRVAGQLDRTGTGLDNAVFTNRSTIRKMADSAKVTLEREALKGIDPENDASCVLIRVKDGYDISAVADDINIHVAGVRATASGDLIASVSGGFRGASAAIGVVVSGILVIAVMIMAMVFVLMMNERKKEFAVLRVAGASRRILVLTMAAETAIVSIVGAVLGVLVSLLLTSPISEGISSQLSLPCMLPDTVTVILLSVCALAAPLAVSEAAALISALRIVGNETGMLLKEDA